ncbi:hypothetical protein FJY71_06965, partial [candidate division WOR-3 bacterium]|nr:hypothetical protein [candidate division WOR-3 bacterium]
MRTASTLLLLTAGLGGTTDAADRHVPGQTIVRFVPALRGELGARGGRIPGLALPCAFRYERVVRRPDENAVARGLDLQCLLTFDPAVDVPALVSRLLADPLVE